MYNIPYFKASNKDEVLQFMRAHPFIILCGAAADGSPVATHVPVLFEERGDRLFLLAHVMRKQAHTEAFQENNHVLAIFYGPSTYVSASWYENKSVASTWNYQAVHVKGQLNFLDENGLFQVLSKLTTHFEHDPHSPALVEKMDKEYVKKMMQAIIAFEIEVLEIEHVFKLSQNRDAASYDNIVRELETKGGESASIASEMKQKGSAVFGPGRGNP